MRNLKYKINNLFKQLIFKSKKLTATQRRPKVIVVDIKPNAVLLKLTIVFVKMCGAIWQRPVQLFHP